MNGVFERSAAAEALGLAAGVGLAALAVAVGEAEGVGLRLGLGAVEPAGLTMGTAWLPQDTRSADSATTHVARRARPIRRGNVRSVRAPACGVAALAATSNGPEPLIGRDPITPTQPVTRDESHAVAGSTPSTPEGRRTRTNAVETGPAGRRRQPVRS